MGLTINLPNSEWNYKISGVYKITLDSGFYYIGGSVHIRSRASVWERFFKQPVDSPYVGSAMVQAVKECPCGRFEILELCSKEDVVDKEAFYLDKYKSDELMVSVSDRKWKPVLQYNAENNMFIKRHVSIQAAARYMSSGISRIQDVINGIRKMHKGMSFIYETDYDEKRKNAKKRRHVYIKSEKRNGRDLTMFTVDGTEVKKFNKIKEAATELNISSTSIQRVLKGSQKTAKGFVFKYV